MFTLKTIILVVFFFAVAVLLFAYASKVLSVGDTDANRQTFKAFYAEKKNTIDVAYLGTSASNRYFINPKAYHDAGISSFTIATMGMPLFFVPGLIDEVEKTQDPDLYIIELRWVLKKKDQITDAHIRRVTDNIKSYGLKNDAINKAFDVMDGDTGMLDDITFKKLDYLFPVIKYHGRLEQGLLGRGDFKLTSSKNKTKGYVISFNTTKQVNQFPSRLSEERAPLTEEVDSTLDEVLDYCDNLPSDKQVLFVLSPYSVRKNQMPIFNTALDKIAERGYTAINFNTPEMYEELGVDWDHDFYNSKHFNYIGAEKYTDWLTSYLLDNYDLEDHRGDPKYESWEEAYKVYEDYVKDGIQTVGHKEKIGGEVTITK